MTRSRSGVEALAPPGGGDGGRPGLVDDVGDRQAGAVGHGAGVVVLRLHGHQPVAEVPSLDRYGLTGDRHANLVAAQRTPLYLPHAYAQRAGLREYQVTDQIQAVGVDQRGQDLTGPAL